MPPDPAAAWAFLPWGYLATVAIELPVLVVCLSARHPPRDRLLAGLLLTAFTYPVVVCVLPPLVWGPCGRGWYLVVAETFAPLAECLLFWAAFGRESGHDADPRADRRDMLAIVTANLLSFGLGEVWRIWQ